MDESLQEVYKWGAEMRLAHCQKAAKKALMGHSKDLLERMSLWMQKSTCPDVDAAIQTFKTKIASMSSESLGDDMEL